VNEVPPATYGLLYFGLSLLANHKSIHKAIDLALDGLIRNRNFLGHGLLPFLGKDLCNLPAKRRGLHSQRLQNCRFHEWNKSVQRYEFREIRWAGVRAIDGAWASKRASTRVQQVTQQVTMLRSVPLRELLAGIEAGAGSDQF
jgi:hypothetical protein